MKEKSRRVISIENAPKAIGPYSQGIAISKQNKLIYFSGQIAINPETGSLIDGDISDETKQILINIDNLLKSEGLTSENVIKTTVFLTDMTKFSEFNAAYADFFSFEPPARSCVEVSALPLNAKVEIEIIAQG